MATGSLATVLMAMLIGVIPADVVAMNSLHFRIPITIKDGGKDKIRELLLFASSDEGKTWNQVGVATPDKDAFVFHAASDGTYWFNIVVVDAQGNRQPPDIYKAPPGQKVLIDTTKPVIKIASAERQGDEIVVAWDVQEAYPDLSKLKLEYKSSDAPTYLWNTAPVTPAMVGQARFRLVNAGGVTVRMTVSDYAGNASNVAQIEIPGRIAQAQPASPPGVGVQSTSYLPLNQPATGGASPVGAHEAVTSLSASTAQPQAGRIEMPPSTAQSGPMTQTQPTPTWPSTANQTATIPAPTWPMTQAQPPVQQAPVAAPAVAHTTVQRPQWENQAAASTQSQPTALRQASASTANPSGWNNATPIGYSAPGGSELSSRNSSGLGGLPWSASSATAAQITNSPQVTLNYEITKVGPSGVGSVELYLTQDDGQTWHRFADDPKLKPPMIVTLPGEGIFGMRLVVGSGAGLGRKPPRPGDMPQMRVEVDNTPPVIKLFVPKADTRRRDVLVLSWSASDKNLYTTPISLQWAQRPDGNAWQTIASDLPNTGSYNWTLPANMPHRVYLRVLARDTAGNVGVDESPEPILVDLSEPEAQIIGIASNPGRQ